MDSCLIFLCFFVQVLFVVCSNVCIIFCELATFSIRNLSVCRNKEKLEILFIQDVLVIIQQQVVMELDENNFNNYGFLQPAMRKLRQFQNDYWKEIDFKDPKVFLSVLTLVLIIFVILLITAFLQINSNQC